MVLTTDAIFLALYSIVMILVILFNFGVLSFMIYKCITKSSRNVLIISLCIADLCVGVFTIPNIILITASVSEWSSVTCKLCFYSEFVSTTASALTITAIALDRFRAILFPIRFKLSKRSISYAAVSSVWMLALLYSFRALMVYDITENQVVLDNATIVTKICTVPMPLRFVHNKLVIIDFILLFGIPVLVLMGTNIAVSVYLRKQNLSNSNQLVAKRMKAIRLLIAMIVIFVICHLPLYVMRIYMLTRKVENGAVILRSFLVMSFINSFTNVFFYSSFSDDVKQFRNKLLKHTVCTHKNKFSSAVHPLQTST